MFCHISFLKCPRITSLPDVMCYVCYFYIAVLFNTFPAPVFVHLIHSKKQWFARLTVKVRLHTLYYLSKKCLGFQACSFIKRCVSIFW